MEKVAQGTSTDPPPGEVAYYPRRGRGWFVIALALFIVALWLVVILAIALAPPPQDPDAKPAGAGPGVVLALILGPFAALLFNIGWGVLRSRAILSGSGLDLTTTRFAIWALRPVRRVQLTWPEVLGVEIFEQTNPYAPQGVQRDYVIHTATDRWAISNILWPQASEIAAAVAQRIGRPIGDVPDNLPPAAANRRRDRVGLKMMQGCGLVAMIACGLMLLLLVLALVGGMSWADFAKAAMACSIGFSAGAAMWRWKMSR